MSIDARKPVVESPEPEMVEVLRQKTPQERLQIAFGMWESARVMIEGAVRHEHPDWDKDQIQAEVVRRISHGEVTYGRKRPQAL